MVGQLLLDLHFMRKMQNVQVTIINGAPSVPCSSHTSIHYNFNLCHLFSSRCLHQSPCQQITCHHQCPIVRYYLWTTSKHSLCITRRPVMLMVCNKATSCLRTLMKMAIHLWMFCLELGKAIRCLWMLPKHCWLFILEMNSFYLL